MTPAELYARKVLVMMETSIADSHANFYILEIKKLSFNLPHLPILGTHHGGNTHRESFKSCTVFQDVLFSHYYTNRVVANFLPKFNLNSMM